MKHTLQPCIRYHIKPTMLRLNTQYLTYYYTWTWAVATGKAPVSSALDTLANKFLFICKLSFDIELDFCTFSILNCSHFFISKWSYRDTVSASKT